MTEYLFAQPKRIAARARGRGRLDVWAPLSLPLLLFLALPLVAVVLRVSPGRLVASLAQPEVRQAIALSLGTSTISAGLAVVLGAPVAYLMARRRFRFQRALDTLIDLPIVLPPAVAGMALLMAFGRRGLLGGALEAMGIHIAFTQTAVVMAQTFIAAPLFIRAATLGFGSIEPELEQAAAIDGAGGRRTLWHITLPLAWKALLSGAIMTWARALGEFGATIIFAGNFPGRTQTMPLAIYLGFELELDTALTLSVILIAASFAVLVLVKSLLHRDLAPEPLR